MPHPLALDLHGLTHPGHVRPHNEDAYLLDSERGLAALADGMGGSLAGEVASAMAIETLRSSLLSALDKRPELQSPILDESGLLDLEALMRTATSAANAAIHSRAQVDAACRGMGTTVVLALWRGSDLLVGHAGDSRAYRLHPRAWRLPTGVRYRHEVQRLTRDHHASHRAPEQRVPAGWTEPDPDGTRLTRAVGVESEVVLELHRHRLQPDDIVLLCSDGLSDVVPDSRIEQLAHEVLGQEAPAVSRQRLPAFGRALVDEALRAGGPDNITVLLGALPPEATGAA